VYVASIDPRNGEVIAKTKSTTAIGVREAVARARIGQKRWWNGLDKEDRIARVLELEKVLIAEKSSVVRLASLETGINQPTIGASYDSAMRGFSHYVGRYRALVDREYPLDQAIWEHTEALIRYEPHGVVGHIGVWNYPFWQTMITFIPALLAGNSIVFKPSQHSTLTGLRIVDLAHQAGIPEDVCVSVVGGPYVGKVLVKAPVDAIAFTGSLAAGKHIIKNAGVKPLILELSGNDAGIICADADIEQAARGVSTGTFSRAGQVCVRVKRVYVLKEIADRFTSRLLEITSRLNLVEQVGPVIREESRARVDKVVKEAVAAGSKLLIGGKPRPGPGFYYEPTILIVNNDDLEVIRYETFGPVCSIRIVDSEDQAIELANRSEYGLGATIWAQDMRKAMSIAERLEVGNVWINEWGRSLNCGDYFQGCKESGIAGSQERIMLFMKKKSVVTHHGVEPRRSWFC